MGSCCTSFAFETVVRSHHCGHRNFLLALGGRRLGRLDVGVGAAASVPFGFRLGTGRTYPRGQERRFPLRSARRRSNHPPNNEPQYGDRSTLCDHSRRAQRLTRGSDSRPGAPP